MLEAGTGDPAPADRTQTALPPAYSQLSTGWGAQVPRLIDQARPAGTRASLPTPSAVAGGEPPAIADDGGGLPFESSERRGKESRCHRPPDTPPEPPGPPFGPAQGPGACRLSAIVARAAASSMNSEAADAPARARASRSAGLCSSRYPACDERWHACGAATPARPNRSCRRAQRMNAAAQRLPARRLHCQRKWYELASAPPQPRRSSLREHEPTGRARDRAEAHRPARCLR